MYSDQDALGSNVGEVLLSLSLLDCRKADHGRSSSSLWGAEFGVSPLGARLLEPDASRELALLRLFLR